MYCGSPTVCQPVSFFPVMPLSLAFHGLSLYIQICISVSLFKNAFPGDISPSSLSQCLMLRCPNIKVGYGITEEAKLDRQSDRKTNGSSLVSWHCSLFLNLAQMLRFKTKLVAVIFSWPFLKRCHLVCKVCENVPVCVWDVEGSAVFPGVYVKYIYIMCREALRSVCSCVHPNQCVREFNWEVWWVG